MRSKFLLSIGWQQICNTTGASSLLICFFFLVPLAAFLKIFSPWVVMLFVGSDLEALTLLPIASPLIVIVAFFILADGLRLIAGQALNGLSDH